MPLMPAAPPGGGGGPPPELLAMLAGRGGPPGAGPVPTGPGGPPGGQGEAPEGNERQAVTFLRQAIDAIQQYLRVEPDDIDQQAAMKVMAGLQQILAKEQKDMESAVGITPQVRFLRKAQGGP